MTTSDQPGYLIKRAQSVLHEAMSAALADHGLTVAQYAALVGAVDSPGASNADLARAAFVTPQTMNLLVRDLERSGLVTRSPHPRHGRVLQTMATDVGRSTAEAATSDVDAIQQRMVAALSRGEQRALVAALTACVEALDPREA